MVAFNPGNSPIANPAYAPGSAPAFDGGGFLPNVLPNLQLWLDAADTSATNIVNIAGAVSKWSDKSGQGNDATQGTASLQPTTGSNTINSNNVITFDVDLLSIAAASSINNMFAGGATVFFVHKSESVGGGAFGRLMEKASGIIYLLTDASGGAQTIRIIQDFSAGNGDWATDNRVIVDDAPTISMLQYNSDNVNNNPTFETDGANSAFTEDGSPSGSSSDDSANPLIIGNRAATDRGYDGDIAEILIYDRLLTATEITSVHSYLSNKWGVTLV